MQFVDEVMHLVHAISHNLHYFMLPSSIWKYPVKLSQSADAIQDPSG
jgi:hypothetical protein